MKRQAIGSSSSETDESEINGSKRLKLLNSGMCKRNNEANDDTEKNSVMDKTQNENSYNVNHRDHLPSTSMNCSSLDQGVPEDKNEPEHSSSQIVNENQSSENGLSYVVETNCNGTCEEVIMKSSDFEVVSESHHSHESSLVCSEDTGDKLSISNNQNPELLNGESTDSFQSEGFEANNCGHEPDNKHPEASTSQMESKKVEKDSSVELEELKNNLDVENLFLSHINVTELCGHSDVIYSVAADEDLVLSASGDTTIRVWSVERQSTINTFSGHSDCVTALLLLSPSQTKLLKKKMSITKVSKIAITGSYDCNIKLWSVLDGKELASVYTFNGISCVGYLESESLIVVGTDGGKIEVWDMSSSKCLKSVHAHDDLVSGIQVKDNYIYSVSVDGTVKVWAYEDEDIYPVYTRKRKEISPDKKRFLPTQWKTVAVSNNVMYLGDNSSNLKLLDWRSGRLRLFKNQSEDQGVSECVTIEKNMLFSTYYDSSSDTGGINVWKLPEMNYICTLTGAITDVCCLAVVQKGNMMRIVSGSHSLLVWDFDFSKPLNSVDNYSVKEIESIGVEIDEKSAAVKAEALKRAKTSIPDQNTSSSKQWCNVM